MYRENCAMCHGDELKGSGSGPSADRQCISPETGLANPWSTLYDKIQTTMPDDDPGKLTRPQAADVLAFILSSNQFPFGKTELPTDEDA